MSKWLPNFMSNFLSAVFLKVLENGESFFISISLLFICTWWYALFTFILNDILIGYEIVGSKFLFIVSRFQVLFHAFSISCVLFVCKCFCFLDAFKVLQLYLTFLNFTKLYLFLCVYVNTHQLVSKYPAKTDWFLGIRSWTGQAEVGESGRRAGRCSRAYVLSLSFTVISGFCS